MSSDLGSDDTIARKDKRSLFWKLESTRFSISQHDVHSLVCGRRNAVDDQGDSAGNLFHLLGAFKK